MIRISREIDKETIVQWEDFICNHPDGCFFQSYSYYKALLNQNNLKPFVLFAFENKELTGVLLATIHNEPHGIFSFLSSRAIVQGGPVIREEGFAEVFPKLLRAFDLSIKRKAIFSQFRNFYDTSDSMDLFKNNGYKFEEHLNIMVNLCGTKEELWSKVHSKRRNEIRRAEATGTTFEVREDYETLKVAYEILQQVYKRARIPLPEYNFFHSFFKQVGPKILKLFVAINSERIIGTMFALCYKDKIYDWYAGAYEEFYKMYPNDLIPWEVFLWGKQEGFTKFDFGGAGKPDVPYGVRDYKKKFGGQFVNYGRYERVNKPILYKLAVFGFKMWKRLKK